MENNVPIALLDRVSQLGAERALVAGSIVAPRHFGAIRVKDGYSSNPTAIASVHGSQKINWDTGVNPDPVTSGKRYIPQNDWGAFVFRNPLRHTVTYRKNSGGPFTYSAIFDFAQALNTQLVGGGSSTWLQPAGFVGIVNPVHGPVLFCGEDDGIVGVWIDATPTSPFSLIQLAVAPNVDVNDELSFGIYRWVNGSWDFIDNTPVIPGGGNSTAINILEPGYYAVKANFDDVDQLRQYSVSWSFISNQEMIWEHRPIPDLLQNINSISAIRILGVSALYKNLASPLNMQGEITIAQVPNTLDWFWSFVATTAWPQQQFYPSIFNLAQEHSHRLEMGAYCFLKPNDEDDFDYFEYITYGNQTTSVLTIPTNGLTFVNDAHYPLRERSDYMVFAASATNLGAGDGFFETAVNVEYETTNKWINRSPPQVSRQAWEDGVELVGMMAQYYENPLHLSKIMGFLRKIAEVASPVLAAVAPFTGPAAPALELAAGAMGAGAAALGALEAKQESPQVEGLVGNKRTAIVLQPRGAKPRPIRRARRY